MPPNKYDFGKMSLKLEGNCKREGGQDMDIGNEQRKSE